jgi:hypothetical protein
MNEKILQALWEDADRLDDALFTLGDALDVKASIVLVLATFLGAVSASILAIPTLTLAPWVKFEQATAVAGLACAVVCCLVALWPSVFSLPPRIEDWESFVTESAGDHKNQKDGLEAVHLELQAARLRVAKKRIAINKRFTDRKAKFNGYAFYATAIVILADGATLLWLARTHL